MKKYVLIKEAAKEYKLSFNKENPYIKLSRLSSGNQIDAQFSIQLTALTNEGTVESRTSAGSHRITQGNVYLNKEWIPPVCETVTVMFSFNDAGKDQIKAADFRLEYEVDQRVLISNGYAKFHQHLSNPQNCKVFFSGKYGLGKTTFLDSFFNNYQEFIPFRISPVNYSISKNEDVLRYIKFEILVQLVKENSIQDELESINIDLKALKETVRLPALKSLLSLVPNVGINPSAAIKEIAQIISDFKKYKERIINNDKDEIQKFLESIETESGSIYENDFYTQTIGKYLDKLRDKDRSPVLVIDDIDRLDPDHIFRIFNIISSHYDNYRLNNTEQSNKFGFDKIVVVGDISNIRYIFEHRYGSNVDFPGYMDKFYSTEIYDFNNYEAAESIIYHYLTDGKNNFHGLGPIVKNIYSLMCLLIRNGDLTLRDIIKFRTKSFWSVNYGKFLHKSDVPINVCRSTFSIMFSILKVSHTFDDLKNIFNDIKLTQLKSLDINVENFIQHLLIHIGDYDKDKTIKYDCVKSNRSYIIHADYSPDYYSLSILDFKCTHLKQVEGTASIPVSQELLSHYFSLAIDRYSAYESLIVAE